MTTIFQQRVMVKAERDSDILSLADMVIWFSDNQDASIGEIEQKAEELQLTYETLEKYVITIPISIL